MIQILETIGLALVHTGRSLSGLCAICRRLIELHFELEARVAKLESRLT